jgi:hypothetical protein
MATHATPAPDTTTNARNAIRRHLLRRSPTAGGAGSGVEFGRVSRDWSGGVVRCDSPPVPPVSTEEPVAVADFRDAAANTKSGTDRLIPAATLSSSTISAHVG